MQDLHKNKLKVMVILKIRHDSGKNLMKTKTVIIIITLIACELIFFFGLGKARDIFLNQHLKDETALLSSSYTSGITNARNISNAFYNVIINSDHGILQLFAEADKASPERKEEIKRLMQQKLRSIYEQQVKLGLKQLQFHTRDSDNFLLMSVDVNGSGPVISSKLTVETANRMVRYTEAFEEGGTFNGVRFVYPLVYNSVHIGSLELGVSAVYLAENMNSFGSGTYDFIVKKTAVGADSSRKPGFSYAQSELAENYLRENVSYEYLQDNAAVFGSIEEYLYACEIFKPIIQNRLTSGEPFSEHTVINGKEITASFLPISNILDQQVAYFIKMSRDNKFSYIVRLYQLALFIGSVTILLIFGTVFLAMQNSYKSEMLRIVLDEKLKEHENRLYIKEQMLFQQSKLATLGEMFSALAHQWKQPLNILAMYVQNMTDEEVDEKEKARREDIVEKCMAQITFMSETINDFMDFIQPSNSLDMKMDMVRTADEVLKLLQPALQKKKIEISVDSGGKKSVFASANPNEFKHVMVNLLNNAKDAIMEVKEKDKMFVGRISIEMEEKDGACYMRIGDNAGGISPEIVEKIFTPYFTTKKKKEGSGLGLYMCKKIIQKHSGDFTVRNENGGAVFEIKLPSVKS